MLQTLRTAALLALITGLWCWVLSALHGVWSLGIIHGYLEGGTIPFYPSLPVTYKSFFMGAFGGFIAPFILVFTLCILVPPRHSIYVIVASWLIGAWIAAANIAFTYQIDFGTTWTSWEALSSLFYHPIFTPVWLALGLIGAASLTRPLRRRAA